MKTTNHVALAVLLTTTLILPLRAQQAPVGSGNPEIDTIIALGTGVQEIKKTDNGLLKSCKVVGQARIPSSLGAADGVNFATSRAKNAAQQAYVEWIKANVKSIHTSGTETIVSLQGGSNGASESGKSSEMDSNSVTTQAEGLVRGLTLIGKKVDPSSQTLSLVFGWSSAYADLTRQAEDANNRSSSTAPSGPTSSGASVDNSAVKAQTVVSPAAKDF